MTTLHAQTLVEHARRAREDTSTCETSSSTRVAAGFLRNRGVSLNVALHILARSY